MPPFSIALFRLCHVHLNIERDNKYLYHLRHVFLTYLQLCRRTGHEPLMIP